MIVLRTSMSSNLRFQLAEGTADAHSAFPLLNLLTPTLLLDRYLIYLSDMKELGNYFLYLAYDKNDVLVGLCGYWLATKFYCGRYLEIDNFIIKPNERGKQFGTQFLDFLEEKAKDAACETIMLDAYLDNHQAHRFYAKNGYVARGFHFMKTI